MGSIKKPATHNPLPMSVEQSALDPEAVDSTQVSKQASTQDRLGRPLRDLRVSVTDRCNFRCV